MVRTHNNSVLIIWGRTLQCLDNSSLQGSTIRGPKSALWSPDTKSWSRSQLGFRRSTEKCSQREELRLEPSEGWKVEREQPPLAWELRGVCLRRATDPPPCLLQHIEAYPHLHPVRLPTSLQVSIVQLMARKLWHHFFSFNYGEWSMPF